MVIVVVTFAENAEILERSTIFPPKNLPDLHCVVLRMNVFNEKKTTLGNGHPSRSTEEVPYPLKSIRWGGCLRDRDAL